MKYLRGIVAILFVFALLILFAFTQGYNLGDIFRVLEATWNASLKSLTNWSTDDLTLFVGKIVSIVLIFVLVLLPVIGLVASLRSKYKNSSRTFLDFVLCLVLIPTVFFLIARSNNDKIDSTMFIVFSGISLGLLLVYDVVCLLELRCKVQPCSLSTTSEETQLTSSEEVDNNVVEDSTVSEVVAEATEEVEKVESSEETEDQDNGDDQEETSEAEGESSKTPKKPSLTYEQRLSGADDSLKENYSTLKNHLLKYRKVHSRITKSCETYRVGYDMIARIVVAGKGLKLYLAMDPYSVDSAIYHQRDASSKKRFVNVPLVVKVKSPLSVKKALKLIDMVCEQKQIQPKSRYQEIDYTKIGVGE